MPPLLHASLTLIATDDGLFPPVRPLPTLRWQEMGNARPTRTTSIRSSLIPLSVGNCRRRCSRLLPFPLHPDPCSLRAIVDGRLLEPWMLQRLLGRDSLSGIIEEDTAQEIQELAVEPSRSRDNVLRRTNDTSGYDRARCHRLRSAYLKPLHGLDIFLRCLRRLAIRIIQSLMLHEESGRAKTSARGSPTTGQLRAVSGRTWLQGFPRDPAPSDTPVGPGASRSCHRRRSPSSPDARDCRASGRGHLP